LYHKNADNSSAVQCSGDSAYTDLTPRQALTAAPYASYARQAPWSGLSGVPAGFADGVDNDTTYTAGTGLTLSGGQFSLVRRSKHDETPHLDPCLCRPGPGADGHRQPGAIAAGDGLHLPGAAQVVPFSLNKYR